MPPTIFQFLHRIPQSLAHAESPKPKAFNSFTGFHYLAQGNSGGANDSCLSIPSPDSTAKVRMPDQNLYLRSKLSIPSPDSTWWDLVVVQVVVQSNFQFLHRIPPPGHPTRTHEMRGAFNSFTGFHYEEWLGSRVEGIFQFLHRIPRV